MKCKDEFPLFNGCEPVVREDGQIHCVDYASGRIEDVAIGAVIGLAERSSPGGGEDGEIRVAGENAVPRRRRRSLVIYISTRINSSKLSGFVWRCSSRIRRHEQCS